MFCSGDLVTIYNILKIIITIRPHGFCGLTRTGNK